MGYSTESKWLTATITFALAALSASAAFSCMYTNFVFSFCVALGSCSLLFFWYVTVYFWKRKSRDLDSKIGELEKSLKTSLDNCAAERQGRIRAQQVPFSSHLLPHQKKKSKDTDPFASLTSWLLVMALFCLFEEEKKRILLENNYLCTFSEI